jgi:hypothetical protein
MEEAMNLLRVTRVDALPGYRLALVFSDGTQGTADLSEHIGRAPFLSLADPLAFGVATLEYGAVEWPGHNIGIATEALYALARGLPIPVDLEQARDQ